MQPLPYTKGCIACGQENPFGLHLHLYSDGTKVQTEFTPAAHHAGFKGVVHGGISSLLLDELMAWVCAVAAGQFAYCAHLSVRFLLPLHPGQTVTAHAELTSNRRRVFEARAEIFHPSRGKLAAAQGKYLPISQEELAAFREDLVGDPSGFLRKG